MVRATTMRRQTSSRRRWRREARREGDAAASIRWDIERVSGSGGRRGRVDRRERRTRWTPRFDVSNEGSGGPVHGSCLPFSRRFEQAPRGRRPDFRPRGGSP
jgi:hypothetical protein